MGSITRYLAQHALALVALVVALGGSAYAATQVGSADIANNSIRSKDIRDNAVKSPDLGSFLESFSYSPHATTLQFLPDTTYMIETGCNRNGQSGGALTATTDVSSPDLRVLGVFPETSEGEPVQSPDDQATGMWVKAVWLGNAPSTETLTTYALCVD
jgi:hypothetical protein